LVDKNSKKYENIRRFLKALDNNNRITIVKYLLGREDKKASLSDLRSLIPISHKSLDAHIKILKDCDIINWVEDDRSEFKNDIGIKITGYFLDEEKFIYMLKTILNNFYPGSIPDDQRTDGKGVLTIYEIMATSIKFMENVPINGKMDICFPSESAKFVSTSTIYRLGYKIMKEREFIIRVITEITKDNFEYIMKIIQDGVVDEIRILKNVRCGMAVSENQYMAAFLNKEFVYNPNARFFHSAVYHTEKEVVDLNKSVFDTMWENATPIYKK